MSATSNPFDQPLRNSGCNSCLVVLVALFVLWALAFFRIEKRYLTPKKEFPIASHLVHLQLSPPERHSPNTPPSTVFLSFRHPDRSGTEISELRVEYKRNDEQWAVMKGPEGGKSESYGWRSVSFWCSPQPYDLITGESQISPLLRPGIYSLRVRYVCNGVNANWMDSVTYSSYWHVKILGLGDYLPGFSMRE